MALKKKIPFPPERRRVSRNYNSTLIKILCERPIAYLPILGQVSNNATSGLFLSQLLYWCDKGADPKWIYKTIQEVQEETCLSRSEQDRAIKVWTKMGVLEVELRGIPRRRYFHIRKKRLLRLLETFSNRSQLPSANQFAENDKLNSSIKHATTEITTETTDKNIFPQKKPLVITEIEAARNATVAKFTSLPKTHHE